MKRQQIRSLFLLLSFMLLPVTFCYYSPYLIIEGALAGVVTGSAILFFLLFLSGLVFGRGACGWIMGCGGLQEALFTVNGNPIGKRIPWIRPLLWISWLCGVAAAMIVGKVHTIAPLYMIEHGVSVSRSWIFIIFYIVVSVFFFVALPIGRRGFCHYGCWMAQFMIMGRKLGNILNLPGLRLSRTNSACTGCGKCTKNCPMSLDVKTNITAGRLEQSECILCGKCADSCPSAAIRLGFGSREPNSDNKKLIKERINVIRINNRK